MARYLLIVTFEPGVEGSPMEEWQPEEITAHLDYYRALNARLAENGELVDTTILTPPDAAHIVRADAGGGRVVTDGPFQEFKEWVAGFQVIDVENEERALEIAALVSAVPGPGGVPLQQPIHVRRVMDDGPSDAAEMTDWLEGTGGTGGAGGTGGTGVRGTVDPGGAAEAGAPRGVGARR